MSLTDWVTSGSGASLTDLISVPMIDIMSLLNQMFRTKYSILNGLPFRHCLPVALEAHPDLFLFPVFTDLLRWVVPAGVKPLNFDLDSGAVAETAPLRSKSVMWTL